MAKNSIGRHPAGHPKPNSVKHILEMAVGVAGDKLAYRYRGIGEGIVDVTYNEFQNDTFYLGTALNSLGLASGHIGCVGENSYQWIVVYLTALKSEGVFCPIDKELPDSDLINIIDGGAQERGKRATLSTSSTAVTTKSFSVTKSVKRQCVAFVSPFRELKRLSASTERKMTANIFRIKN